MKYSVFDHPEHPLVLYPNHLGRRDHPDQQEVRKSLIVDPQLLFLLYLHYHRDYSVVDLVALQWVQIEMDLVVRMVCDYQSRRLPTNHFDEKILAAVAVDVLFQTKQVVVQTLQTIGAAWLLLESDSAAGLQHPALNCFQVGMEQEAVVVVAIVPLVVVDHRVADLVLAAVGTLPFVVVVTVAVAAIFVVVLAELLPEDSLGEKLLVEGAFQDNLVLDIPVAAPFALVVAVAASFAFFLAVVAAVHNMLAFVAAAVVAVAPMQRQLQLPSAFSWVASSFLVAPQRQKYPVQVVVEVVEEAQVVAAAAAVVSVVVTAVEADETAVHYQDKNSSVESSVLVVQLDDT